MNDITQYPPENAFLKFLKKMAAENKLTVEQFAVYCHYTPEGIEFLKQYPWFQPSTAILGALREEVENDYEKIEWTEELICELWEISDANGWQDDDDARKELLRLWDILPSYAYESIVETARKAAECCYCFGSLEFPKRPDFEF